MSAAKIPQASTQRQKVLHFGKEIISHLQSIVNAKRLTKGTICNKTRKCGNPRCKCAHGKLHTTKILSLSHHGHSKVIHLGKYSVLELRHIELQVRAYQRFRIVRAHLASIYKELMSEINILESHLLTEIKPRKGVRHGTKEKKA